MRRNDPVKRACWIAALLITFVLVWASSLQLRALLASSSLGRVNAKINLSTNEFSVVAGMQREIADMTQKLAALHSLTESRFLNGNLMDALQHTTIEDVQLTRLRVDQSFLYVEGTKARTNGTKVVAGIPPRVTEKTTLTLDGADASHTAGDQITHVKEAIDKHPYFHEHLGENGVSWKNSSSPTISPESGRPEVMFTFECRYPEITR